MRETENCALRLTIFYLGTSFRGLLLTSSGAKWIKKVKNINEPHVYKNKYYTYLDMNK